jgi:hypothetical protein
MVDVIIIGNGFKDFSDRKSIWSVSDYLKEVDENIAVSLGQGLTCQDIQTVQNKAKHVINNISQVPKQMTHQHNDRNVLIFNFNNTKIESYQANIYIRGENDLLQDHITGSHISGMILVESARQLFITSLMSNGYVNDRFVLNDINASFLSYVFPTEISMRLSYHILENTKNKKKVVAKAQALQKEKICAEFQITATLIPNKLAAISEHLSNNEFKKVKK